VLIRQLGDAGAALELRRLPDAPPGEGRYFFCNKALPDRQLKAIDDAMGAAR
jgi:polar amino acid transport system substrate-binding protein